MKKTFSIRELENLSGIKRHTLRVWETRYKMLTPLRSTGNKRMYSLTDLQMILNFSLLIKTGRRIARLSSMSTTEVETEIAKIQDGSLTKIKAVNDLIICMYCIEVPKFQKVLQQSMLAWPIDIVITDILHDFLKRTNLLWAGNRLTEEHFAVTAIRNKIIVGFENLGQPATLGIKALLFLTDKGQFDMGLNYAGYILRAKGVDVLYMGHDISAFNLREAIASQKPDYLLTQLPARDRKINFTELLQSGCHPATLITVSEKSRKKSAVTREGILDMELQEAISFICNN